MNILPGSDGSLYLTITESEIVEKLDVDLKSLVDSAPFTLPIMSDIIFLGDKQTQIFKIDLDEGNILSRFDNLNKIKQNALDKFNIKTITVFRTDYILKAVFKVSNENLWSLTVSEILILDKQGKTEISYKEYSPKLEYGINKEIKNMKSAIIKRFHSKHKILSIYDYNPNLDLPVKIFSNKDKFEQENKKYTKFSKKISTSLFNPLDPLEKLHKRLKDFLNKTKLKTRFFLFVNYDYINIYTFLILILTCICILVTYFSFKFYRANQELQKQIKMLKEKEINMDSLSAKSTDTKLEKSLKSIKDNKNKYKEYLKAENFQNNFAVIHDNFEGQYDGDDKNQDESSSVSDQIERKNNFEYLDYQNSSMESYSNLLPNNDFKIKEFEGDKSLRSIKSEKSVNTQFSKKSQCKLQIIKTEEEFNDKSKNPFLLEAFQINQKKTDMSSTTECIVEEDEQNIKKTEFRKIVTVYIKDKNRAMSFEEQQIKRPDLPRAKNMSMKINVNTQLSKNNLKVCWETTDFGTTHFTSKNSGNLLPEHYNQNSLPMEDLKPIKSFSQTFEIKPNEEYSQRSDLFKRRMKSDNISFRFSSSEKKYRRKFSLDEIYKQELLQLEDNYLKSTKEKLGLSKINESFLLKKDVSLTRKHMEILKLINELSDPSDSVKESISEEKYSLDYSIFINRDIFDTGRFIKNFEEIMMIGKGGFGCVFKARHKIDRSEYAIKIIKLKIGANENLSEQEVVKEIKTMMKLHNKNVVRYITCWFELNEYNFDGLNGMKQRSKSSLRRINSKVSDCKSKSKWFEKSNDYEYDSDIFKNSFVQFEGIKENDKKESRVLNSKRENIIFSKDDSKIIFKSRNIKIKQEPKFPVYFYMQIEYCKGFPLSYYLENRKSETEESLIFYMFKQILSALNHIHHHNIIHRDLK